MIFCINHPHREATYDTPEEFCDLCWVMWWTEDYIEDDSESLLAIRLEDLKQIWAECESLGDKLEKEMLEEIAELTKKERDNAKQ